MKVLDDILVEKVFQPFSEWLTDRTGRTCYFWSKECFVAAFVFGLATNPLDWHEWIMEGRYGWATFAIMTSLIWWGYFLRRFIKEADALDKKVEASESTVMNQFRETERYLRFWLTLWFALGISLIGFTDNSPEFIAILLALYLKACEGRPPMQRVKEIKLAPQPI